MATPKKLNFCSSNDSSPSLPGMKSKSQSQPTSKKLASSSLSNNRIWDEENELLLLKELVTYRAKTGLQPNLDWPAFLLSLRERSVLDKFSKDQLSSKISKLKRKFLVNDYVSTDSHAYRFSSMIWGPNEPKLDDTENKTASAGEEEEEEEEEAVRSDLDDKLADKNMTDAAAAAGKEDATHDDDLCCVRDAFETLISKGLTNYQNKLQLEKVMNVENGKRKQISNEWKVLCAEETELKIKKLRLTAKLAEVANGTAEIN